MTRHEAMAKRMENFLDGHSTEYSSNIMRDCIALLRAAPEGNPNNAVRNAVIEECAQIAERAARGHDWADAYNAFAISVRTLASSPLSSGDKK